MVRCTIRMRGRDLSLKTETGKPGYHIRMKAQKICPLILLIALSSSSYGRYLTAVVSPVSNNFARLYLWCDFWNPQAIVQNVVVTPIYAGGGAAENSGGTVNTITTQLTATSFTLLQDQSYEVMMAYDPGQGRNNYPKGLRINVTDSTGGPKGYIQGGCSTQYITSGGVPVGMLFNGGRPF